MKILVLFALVIIAVFALSSFLGFFLAWRDIHKYKNDDCKYRKSRKEIIEEKQKGCNYNFDCDSVLSAVGDLSDEERAEFEKQLLAKFNEGGNL